jgi:iron complex outermembrane recepter protein
VDAFEIGAKSQLFDGRVQLNGAIFYDKYKNLQVTVALGAEQEVLNAASADIKGAELDAAVLVTDNFTFKLGGSYLDTRYNEFLNAPCSLRDPSGATVEYVCNPTGNKLIRAPNWQGNLGGEYKIPSPVGDFALNLTYFWTAKFDWEVDGRLVEPAYGLLNGQLAWTSNDKHYITRVFGKNLTNREYSTYTTSQPGLGDTYAPGAPRTYGVEFEYDF